MKKIIVANWKMNPSSAKEARRLFGRIKIKARKIKGAEIVIAPPLIYLPFFSPSKFLKLGAQDVSFEDSGYFTGEVSAKMLRNSGVSYVMVGHSERRELGEANEVVHKKFAKALSKGLRAILCVGERERARESFPSLVREEIKSALRGIPKRFSSRAVIAYEPLWALSYRSGGKAASPDNFFEMSIFIRRQILDLWGKRAAFRIPILYGGSVNSKNAKSFLGVKGTSGLLVGKASLEAREFNKILEAAYSR